MKPARLLRRPDDASYGNTARQSDLERFILFVLHCVGTLKQLDGLGYFLVLLICSCCVLRTRHLNQSGEFL